MTGCKLGYFGSGNSSCKYGNDSTGCEIFGSHDGEDEDEDIYSSETSVSTYKSSVSIKGIELISMSFQTILCWMEIFIGLYLEFTRSVNKYI